MLTVYKIILSGALFFMIYTFMMLAIMALHNLFSLIALSIFFSFYYLYKGMFEHPYTHTCEKLLHVLYETLL